LTAIDNQNGIKFYNNKTQIYENDKKIKILVLAISAFLSNTTQAQKNKKNYDQGFKLDLVLVVDMLLKTHTN
jgi:fatty acid-binding protein DegV